MAEARVATKVRAGSKEARGQAHVFLGYCLLMTGKPTEALTEYQRAERLFPGEGGIDVRGILAAMPLDIPYTLEIPRVTLASLIGEKECARLAIMAARRHLDAQALVESLH